MNVPKSTEVALTVSVFKEGDYFVAFAPALDIATHGRTLKDAKRNFDELVTIFFQELEEHGNADEVLGSLGWVRKNKKLQPPVEVEHKLETFNVPTFA